MALFGVSLAALWPFLLALIAALALITFMLVSAIFSVWLERKVAGRIQDRLGPTRVGGKFGWLQTLADGMKLLVKEDIIPTAADHMLFRVGPYIALAGSFMAFLALPFGNGVVAQEMNIAVFYMLAIMSTEVFGIILIGYGSGSKWSLFGGMREAAQMVSYEIPMAICVIVPVIVAGTMNLSDLARQQGGFLFNWYVFHDPFTFAAFFTYFTCATASCKRASFDLAEAESELVAGFHTEYSGFRWLSIFMAEYGSMVAVSGIASLMFLGGWNTGLLPLDLYDLFAGLGSMTVFGLNISFGIFGNLINVVVFIFKCWFLVFVMMWIRWTLPRLRIDQVMMTCLKYLLPISCVLLMGVSLWQLALPEWFIQACWWGIFGVSMAALAMLLWKVWTWTSAPPATGMPGMWRNVEVPGYQGGEALMDNLHAYLFWVIALLTALCAIATVVTQNIVRSATWLLFTLAGTSGIFFLLGADLVGAVQLLVYVGGTLVLVVFGVMLTAQGPFINMKTGSAEWAISAVAGLLLLTVLAIGAISVGKPGPPAGSTVATFAPRDRLIKETWEHVKLREKLRAKEISQEKFDKDLKDLESAESANSPYSSTIGQGFLGVGVGPAYGETASGRPIRAHYLLPFEIVSVHLLVVLIGAAYLARAKRRRSAAS